MTFSGDLVLRTHMRMNGSWHIYRPAERWQLPRSAMRIVIEAIARRVLLDNVMERSGPGMITYPSGRRTTGRMRPEDRLWVYSRGGLPCRRCGTPIESRKRGDDARVTYWCPDCQRLEL